MVWSFASISKLMFVQVGKEVGMRGAVRGGGVWGVTSPKEIEEFLRDFDSTENMQEE